MIKEKIQKKFEADFEEEVREILILTDDSSGCAIGMEDKVWKPARDILAYVDWKTGEAVEGKGRVEWLAEDKDRGTWIYNLKAERIYRIQARRKKPQEIPDGSLPRPDNAFMLVKVIKRNESHPELERILEAYRQPVCLEDEQCGTFELEKQFDWFANAVDWMGEECSVSLACEDGGIENAVQAQKAFHVIYDELEAWDHRFRKYAAEKLTELANDWLEEEAGEDGDGQEEQKITEEKFASRMGISELTVYPSGDYEVYYQDDDMFWGHIIIVNGNVETGIEDAYIAG